MTHLTEAVKRPLPDLIDSDRLPTRALRDSETYLKRQTFKVENAAVLALLALYREAYRDITALLNGVMTRTEAEARIAERTARFRRDVLLIVGAAVGAAFLGGYYGKVWQISMATLPTVPVNVRRLITAPPDALREQIDIEIDALNVDIRRVLAAGGIGTSVALARRLRRTMGADSTRRTPHGNFNRVQVLTRTGVQGAANTGAIITLRENAPTVVAYEWLTARDERVCPICAPRDGKRYTLDTWERPPIHPQCRCTLVPILRDGVQVESTAPLRSTFPEWLLTIGIRRELDGFLKQRA